MRILLFAALLLLAFAAAGQANIGETQAAIEMRLGSPVFSKDGEATYEKNGFRIGVVYQKGVSVAEIVNALPVGKQIPDEDRAKLFAVYGGGQEWQQVGDEKTWDRADQKVFAMINEQTGQMMFLAADYARFVKGEQAAEKARSFTDVFGPVPSPAASVTKP